MDSPDDRPSLKVPKPLRVLIVHSHPVQYLAPLFRRYAASAELELTVAYADVPSVAAPFDSDFGQPTDWGVDLLGGYHSVDLSAPSVQRWRAMRVAAAVARLVRRGEFDLVVAYGYSYPASWISLMAAKASGVKWVFVGDNHTLESQRGTRRPGKRLFLRSLGLLADGIFAASTRSQSFYREFASANVYLVPHAVDDVLFTYDTALGSADVPRASRSTVFLFVGKLIPRKRVADLVDAAKEIPDAELWIVGTGSEMVILRERAAVIGDRVKFLGFRQQTELVSLYNAADALVLPSAIETYGMVVNEAAVAGLPAIVSDACGVVDSVVVNGRTGFVYPTGDVQALADSMRRMTSRDLRLRLRGELKQKAQSWSAEANTAAFVRACRATVLASSR